MSRSNKNQLTFSMQVFIFFLLSIFLTTLSGCDFTSQEDHPNIVLIINDTLRSDRLGCYGYPAPVSPSFDSLAREGIQFSSVMTQCSWTRPSIGSMLTSNYPRTVGIFRETEEILPDRFLTLPEALDKNGYTTIGINTNPHLNKVFNFHQGYNHYMESTVVMDWMPYEEDKYSFTERTYPPAHQVFQTALAKVSEIGDDDPIFLSILIMDIHECLSSFKLSEIREYFNEPGNVFSNYPMTVRQINFDTRLLLSRLLSIPGWEDTIVILTSDHGEGLDTHPNVERSISHGHLLYESQLMVPWIVYNPSWKDRSVLVSEMVRWMDLAPTVCSLAGLDVPESFKGISLMPLIHRKTDAVKLPEYFVAETHFRNNEKIAVYSDKWKYIENRDGHEGLNPVELQRLHNKEDGLMTDRYPQYKYEADPLKNYLRQWERHNPKADPITYEDTLSLKEVRQMKSMGYMK